MQHHQEVSSNILYSKVLSTTELGFFQNNSLVSAVKIVNKFVN